MASVKCEAPVGSGLAAGTGNETLQIEDIRRRLGGRLATVFGSSAPTDGSLEYEHARSVGRVVAAAGYVVVNGGYGGTMAASARGAQEAGGAALGVVIDGAKWVPNPRLSERLPVRDHLARLIALAELGDAYVVLPGGTGTMLELAYVWEAMNKGWLAPRPAYLMGPGWAVVAAEVIRAQPRAAAWVTTLGTVEELGRALGAAQRLKVVRQP